MDFILGFIAGCTIIMSAKIYCTIKYAEKCRIAEEEREREKKLKESHAIRDEYEDEEDNTRDDSKEEAE